MLQISLWKNLINYILKPIIYENKTQEWENFINILEKNPKAVLEANIPEWVSNKVIILDQGLEFTNLIKNYDIFSDFYEVVNDYFNSIGNHHQHAALKLDLNTKCSITVKLVWTLTLFNALAGTQPVITPDNKIITKLLVEVVEIGSSQLEIYYTIYFNTTQNISIKFFKKYLYALLHNINLKNLLYFKIRSEQKLKFINLKEFFSDKSSINPLYTKLTIIELNIQFDTNKHKRYRVNTKPVKFFFKNNKYYTYTEIKLTANLVLLQHYAREPTIISEKFIDAVQHLSSTQYFIDTHLLEQYEKLIINQLDLLWQELECLTDTKIDSPLGVKKLLSINSKKVYYIKNVKCILQQLLLKNINNYSDNNQSALITEKKANMNSCLIKMLFAKINLENQLNDKVGKLQELFSKVYQYTNFLTYVSYLQENSLKFVYFTPFADFRGRLYYHSEASIQSIWCFRYIYYFKKSLSCEYNIQPLHSFEQHFFEINFPNCKNSMSLEFIFAIGVMFKTEVIDKATGAFNIVEILQLGLKYYEKYKNLDLILESQNFDLKNLAELYYYIYAFSKEQHQIERGYYVWKDTTASVIQHGGKLLGYNTTMLPYINLQNDTTAYDTYQIVINELKLRLKKNTNLPVDIIDSLNRKILKQLIMTCEYQVSWRTAHKKFSYLISATIKDSINVKKLLNSELFRYIYKTLKGGLVAELFFQKNNRDWYLSNSNSKLVFTDLVITNIYFKPSYMTLYFDKKNVKQRERFTMKVLIPSWDDSRKKELNMIKMRQAAYVNCVHAYDALYLRTICIHAKLSEVELASVHDGFGIPYYNNKWLIKAANHSFWPVKNSTNIFSTTIIT